MQVVGSSWTSVLLTPSSAIPSVGQLDRILQSRSHTTLRAEQAALVEFAVVPDLDMAGARGAALGALFRPEVFFPCLHRSSSRHTSSCVWR